MWSFGFLLRHIESESNCISPPSTIASRRRCVFVGGVQKLWPSHPIECPIYGHGSKEIIGQFEMSSSIEDERTEGHDVVLIRRSNQDSHTERWRRVWERKLRWEGELRARELAEWEAELHHCLLLSRHCSFLHDFSGSLFFGRTYRESVCRVNLNFHPQDSCTRCAQRRLEYVRQNCSTEAAIVGL